MNIVHDVGPINYIAKIKVITANNNYNSDGKKLKCMCTWLYEYSVGYFKTLR